LPSLRPQVDQLLQEALRTGTPAMQARARRLLAWRITERPSGQRVQPRQSIAGPPRNLRWRSATTRRIRPTPGTFAS
jgi:hypothetical protein